MKNVFEEFSWLYTANKGISELQEMSIETSKMEIQWENDGEREEIQNNNNLGAFWNDVIWI